MNIENIKNLLRAYFYKEGKRDLIYSFGMMFIIAFLGCFIAGDRSIFLFIAVVMMLVYPSRVFISLYQSSSRIHYLLIPASNNEKVLSSMLLVNIYYVFGMMICLFSGVFLGMLLEMAISSTPIEFNELTSIFRDSVVPEWSSILTFYLALSISFFACIYFRKNPLGKLFGVLILCFIVLMAVFAVTHKLNELAAVPREILNNSYIVTSTKNINFADLNRPVDIVLQSIGIVFFYALSFLRMKETEV